MMVRDPLSFSQCLSPVHSEISRVSSQGDDGHRVYPTLKICDAVSSSEKASRVLDPPAMATGSIGNSQPVAAPPLGGDCSAPMADPGLTIPQKGGLTDIKTASAIVGARIDQEAVSPSGGLLRVSNTPLAGTGVDGDDQTGAVEPPGGKGHLTVSTGMEVETSDKQKDQETSLA